MPKKIAEPLNMNFRYFVKLGFQAEGYEGSELDYDREFKKTQLLQYPRF